MTLAQRAAHRRHLHHWVLPLTLLLGACSARSEVAANCENAAIDATHELGGEPAISDRHAMVQACLRRHLYAK